LFSGCGGLSLCFQKAGFTIVKAFDMWKPAIETYKKNFDHPISNTDLNDTEAVMAELENETFDMVIGGPPCQDFSHAGKRVEGARADLTEKFVDIVIKSGVQLFLMENVDRAKKSSAYTKARKRLKDCGFGLTEIVLNAALCGVPQTRKRFICIGSKTHSDQFLEGVFANNLSDTKMTVRDYFGKNINFEFYYRHPRNYSRRAVFSIDEPAPTIRGVNRPIPKGYPGHRNDAAKISKSTYVLDTTDRARIQTFPKNFTFVGSKTEVEQMIGNAVPVNLGEFIAKNILEIIEKTPSKVTSFKDWLISVKDYKLKQSYDIVSRINRCEKYLSYSILETSYEAEEIFLQLSKKKDFNAMSSSMKSHCKKALILMNEYKQLTDSEPDGAVVS
jgi:DNA (cytosine-5)-methyltransferase 1